MFIAASVTDFFDGYLARAWQQQSAIGRILDPIADKLLVATALLLLVSDGHHRQLVAARRDHHPHPRDLGLRPARIPRRAAGQRAGHAARQVEDHACRWSRSASCSSARPATGSLRYYFGDLGLFTYVGLLLLWVSALITLYTGYDYFRAGLRHLMEEEK